MASKANNGGHLLRQVINIVAICLVIILNFIAATGVFEQSPWDVSAAYKSMWSFNIEFSTLFWVLFYAFLFFFAIWQVLPRHRNNKRVRAVDWTLYVVLAMNLVVTFSFSSSNSVWVTAIAALIWTVAAGYMYHRLSIGKTRVNHSEYWMVNAVFAAQFAAAAFVFTHACAAGNVVDGTWWGTTETAWTMFALVGLTIFGTIMSVKRPDFMFQATMAFFMASVSIEQFNRGIDVMALFAGLVALYFTLATYYVSHHKRAPVS